jgi:hypothetical protein
MHGVPAQQAVEARAFDALDRQRPGLRHACDQGRLRILGQQQALQPAGRIGERGCDGVQSVQPDRAAWGGRARSTGGGRSVGGAGGRCAQRVATRFGAGGAGRRFGPRRGAGLGAGIAAGFTRDGRAGDGARGLAGFGRAAGAWPGLSVARRRLGGAAEPRVGRGRPGWRRAKTRAAARRAFRAGLASASSASIRRIGT